MPIVEEIQVSRGEIITLHLTEVPNRDLTGKVISFTCSKSPDNPNKLFQVTATLVDAPNSKYDVIISKDQTDQNPGTYYYDIWLLPDRRIMREGDFVITGNAKVPPLG